MVFISSVAPASTAAPAANIQPQTVVQAAAAASASPTAQQLLPVAVVAATLVPRFETKTPKPPETPKTPKTLSSTPSSALAAQLLAQSPEASEEEIALFTPRQAVDDGAQEQAAESFVSPRMPGEAAAQPQAKQAAVTTMLQSFSSLATMAQTQERIKARVLQFTVQQAVAGKKESLTLTRGAAAYTATKGRPENMLTKVAVEAIS